MSVDPRTDGVELDPSISSATPHGLNPEIYALLERPAYQLVVPEEDATPETQRSLNAVLATIGSHLQEKPELHSPVTNWQDVSLELLESARAKIEAGEASDDTVLVAAFACSLLAHERAVRETFLTTVFSMGLNQKMAAALSDSFINLKIGPPDRRIMQSFKYYAAAFQVSDEEVDFYIKYTKVNLDEEELSKLGSKQIQKTLRQAYETDSADEALVASAQAKSRAKEGKKSVVIDPYKVERYALEEMFIRDQIQAVFPDGSLRDSPFASLLAQKRQQTEEGDTSGPFDKLIADAKNVLSELTQPVIEKYRVDPSEIPAELSPQQRAFSRFQQVWQKAINLIEINKYIDYFHHYGPAPDLEIWTAAMRGDGLEQITPVISRVIHGALSLDQSTDTPPTAEELHGFTQQNRKALIRLAMINLDDFRQVSRQEEFSRIALADLGKPDEEGRRPVMKRLADGSLELSLPIAERKIRDTAPVHSGVTLGCIAGRVALDGAKEKYDRGVHSTDNFVDYLVEIIIEEAHKRDMFNLKNY